MASADVPGGQVQPDTPSDLQELEQQLAQLLLAQNADQRDLAVMKTLIARRAKEITALSDKIDALRDGGE